jgi:hypothetical protein
VISVNGFMAGLFAVDDYFVAGEKTEEDGRGLIIDMLDLGDPGLGAGCVDAGVPYRE